MELNEQWLKEFKMFDKDEIKGRRKMMYAIYCIKDDTIFNKTDDKNAVIEKCNQLNKDLIDHHGAKEPWYKAVEINVIGE